MPNTNETAEELIKKHAPEISEQIIQSAKEAWGNEAQFRGNLARGQVFEGFANHLDLHLQPQEERTLINGRADAVYNRFVIEYEPPGSLTAKDSAKNHHAVNQIKQYIENLVKLERHKPERLAGVVTDGCYFIFGRFRGGIWHEDEPLPVNAYSTERFLASLYLLSTEKALTAENLVRDFGENSNVARITVSTVYKALTESQNPKVSVIYKQWQQQFSEVCGYEEGPSKLDLRTLSKGYGIQDPKPNAFKLFFSIHTYYATFIKLLAVQVVHYYMAPKLGTTLPQLATFQTDQLKKYLKNMERGGIFKDLGINNFLEGDFFGWYIEIWDDLVDKGIRRVVSELANYSLVTLDADPDQTRDLLKKLYQNVMPKQLRHDLGEYYTPDWLAERLLNQLGFTSEHEPKLQEKRLLDPACGSGTFLVLAIKRVKEHSADRPIKPADLLHKILNNITGFDLNPLAVISARTNYLLALGDLLEAPRDFEVNIPVYLCDSILTPSQAEEKIGDQYRMREAEERLYKFKTVVGEFAVPGSLVKAQYIDQLAGLVEECVEGKYSLQDFRKRVLHSFPLVETTDNIEIRVLEQLYTKIKDLDERAINGIWARIIKNAFAPLFCGRFDYIAGNPPWVNWEHLPDDYREQTSAMWSRFNLFAPLESKSRLHSERSKVDISVLMLCSSMNDYLSTSGVLGFVITQTVFKAEAARGFRRFTLPDNKPFAILHVDDMITLQPFDGANNRTTVVLAHKNQITSYPIPYTYWKKIQPRTTLSSDMTLDQVISITKRTQWIAQPVDPRDPLAPWLTGRPKAVRSLGSCIGQSPYYDIVREGSNTRGANGVFWIKKVASRPDDLCVIINQADIGKNKKIDAQQGAVEQELLRPLLRGQDIQRWAAIPEIEILLPYSDDGKLIAPNVLKEKYPKTYAFLGRFESLLRSRSHFRNFNPATGIFYEMYNVGNYTMCPYKVVWREVSDTIQASVVPQGLDQNRIIVPDHTVVAIGLDDIKEAHFICALVNSSISNYIVQAYISLHPSPHVMKYIGVPLFDKQNKIHLELASLSEEAHLATSDCNMAGVVDLETRIDDITARLWNIAPDELREIRESLAELK